MLLPAPLGQALAAFYNEPHNLISIDVSAVCKLTPKHSV